VTFPRARRKTLAVLLAGLFMSATACGRRESGGGAVRPASGRMQAPAFVLNDTAGHTVSLSQFKGKVVLLDFWATWCGPCRLSMPALEKLHEEYGPKGLQVLGINIDEDPSGVAQFAHDIGVSYPVLLGGSTGVDNRYGVSGIPAFLLLDRRGRAADSWVGFDPSFAADWRRSIDKVLAEE
jgi:thiol-disulfide isomerase/thioredoxin